MAGFVATAVLALSVGCSAPPLPARQFQGRTRVACVGDSITAGSGLSFPEVQAYPAVLGELLGPAYEVRNFGVSGTTLLREGDHPYVDTAAYTAAREFLPNVVVIVLGTNDSKPQNWQHHAAFERDASSLVRAFEYLPSQPTVYVCTPPPVFHDRWGINDATVRREIAPKWRQLCAREGWALIDLQEALRGRESEFPDGVHPDVNGARTLAGLFERVFRGR